MKFQITLKDPDGVYDSLLEAAHDQVGPAAHTQAQTDAVELARAKLYDEAAKFIECGEYLTVEIDTVAGTCSVVPPR